MCVKYLLICTNICKPKFGGHRFPLSNRPPSGSQQRHRATWAAGESHKIFEIPYPCHQIIQQTSIKIWKVCQWDWNKMGRTQTKTMQYQFLKTKKLFELTSLLHWDGGRGITCRPALLTLGFGLGGWGPSLPPCRLCLRLCLCFGLGLCLYLWNCNGRSTGRFSICSRFPPSVLCRLGFMLLLSVRLGFMLVSVNNMAGGLLCIRTRIAWEGNIISGVRQILNFRFFLSPTPTPSFPATLWCTKIPLILSGECSFFIRKCL